MSKSETRAFAPSRASFEFRADEEAQTLAVSGYASVFNQESHGEIVEPTAFDRTLSHGADVRLLVNHDGVPLARTRSGTLTLRTDDHGLWFESELDEKNPTVAELRSSLWRGDIDQASFGFRVPKGGETVDDDGVRHLREVKLHDVSIVAYPWYASTAVSLNSSPELTEALTAIADGRELNEPELVAVRGAIETLEPHSGTESEQSERFTAECNARLLALKERHFS